MNVTQIYISNGGFLLTELYESTTMKKISKTLLRRNLAKLKHVVLTLKLSLMDKFK